MQRTKGNDEYHPRKVGRKSKVLKEGIKSGQAEMRSTVCAIQREMRVKIQPYGHSWMRRPPAEKRRRLGPIQE
jgi:hypothetical protein